MNKSESISELNSLRIENGGTPVNPDFFDENIWPVVVRGLEHAKEKGVALKSDKTYPALVLGDEETWKTINFNVGSEVDWGKYDGKRRNLDTMQLAYLMGQLNQRAEAINIFLLPESRKTRELLMEMSEKEGFAIKN